MPCSWRYLTYAGYRTWLWAFLFPYFNMLLFRFLGLLNFFFFRLFHNRNKQWRWWRKTHKWKRILIKLKLFNLLRMFKTPHRFHINIIIPFKNIWPKVTKRSRSKWIKRREIHLRWYYQCRWLCKRQFWIAFWSPY